MAKKGKETAKKDEKKAMKASPKLAPKASPKIGPKASPKLGAKASPKPGPKAGKKRKAEDEGAEHEKKKGKGLGVCDVSDIKDISDASKEALKGKNITTPLRTNVFFLVAALVP